MTSDPNVTWLNTCDIGLVSLFRYISSSAVTYFKICIKERTRLNYTACKLNTKERPEVRFCVLEKASSSLLLSIGSP